MADAHHTGGYVRARAALRALQLQPCCLCELSIDYRLHHPSPWAYTAEHVVPARHGGDHTTLLPAHQHCQNRQGAGVTNGIRSARRDEPRTSGVW